MNTTTKSQPTEPMTGTELALAPSRDLEAAFASTESVDGIVEKITEAAKAQAAKFDTTTPTGRAAIKSVAHTVAKSKVALDAKGKNLNDERRAAINVVDAGRRKIREQLDELRDEIRKPVSDWEDAEVHRVTNLRARLSTLSIGNLSSDSDSDSINRHIDSVARTKIDDSWQDFLEEAAKLKDATLETLRNFLDLATRREAMEKELEERRAADAERERLDAYEAMQTQAEADNKAFDQAVADAEIARAEAAERARRDVEQAAANATKAAEDKAEADRVEAERKHRQELADAETKRQADKKKADDEQASRDANKKRRTDAQKDIAAFLGKLDRKQVVEALMNNEVPHVTLIL